MKKFSLTSAILSSQWLSDGVVANHDGTISKAYVTEPMPSGDLEEEFSGSNSDSFFTKLSDLLSKLPNNFDGQVMLVRRLDQKSEMPGYHTSLYFFERVQKAESYSHIHALLSELKMSPLPLTQADWQSLLKLTFGDAIQNQKLPDLSWEKDFVRVQNKVLRTLSLTELPQVTWKGCLQTIFEYSGEKIKFD